VIGIKFELQKKAGKKGFESDVIGKKSFVGNQNYIFH